MKTLTVFTPAYNRAHTITRTYESMCRQSCRDFEWLIIDDGSSDNTEALVSSWMQTPEAASGRLQGYSIHAPWLKITYIRQNNQGMHGAHNTAYKNITTELNTCIDSDDYMPDDAVEKIISFWKSQTPEDQQRYAGIIGLDKTENGTIIGTRFPNDMHHTTLGEYYARGGSGDKKLVYRTEVINQYPEYPLFEGERYVGLAYKYMLIDRDYQLLVLDEPLVTVEYQLDGSSYNMYRQYWRNPKGFSFFRKTEMVCAPTLKRQFISCIHYVASSLIAGNRNYLKESPRKLLTMMATPAGILWYMRIYSKVKSNSKMNFK